MQTALYSVKGEEEEEEKGKTRGFRIVYGFWFKEFLIIYIYCNFKKIKNLFEIYGGKKKNI